jgi:hypothetical protein
MAETCISLNHGLHMAVQLVHILRYRGAGKEYRVRLSVDQLKRYRGDMSDADIVAYEHALRWLFRALPFVRIVSTFNEKSYGVPYESYTERYDLIRSTVVAPLDFLCGPTPPPLAGPYICINTKIAVMFDGDFRCTLTMFHAHKARLYEILNAAGLPVVILGERKKADCVEYGLQPMESVYENHVANLARYVDETYSESKDGHSVPLLQKTCTYLNHSVLNVFLGNGGGIHLYASFPNTVQLGVLDRLLKYTAPENLTTRPFSTLDPELFLAEIEKRLT